MARRLRSPLRKSRKSPVQLVCKIKKSRSVRRKSRKSGRRKSGRRKSGRRKRSRRDGACGCDNGLADGCSE